MKLDVENPAYSFASLVLKIDGDEYSPKAVKYSDSMSRGDVRANHPMMLGMTRGEYTADPGSVELYMKDFLAIQKKLGTKMYTKAFQIVATYAEDGSDTVTDTVVGCKFKKRTGDSSQGNTALMRPLEFDCMYIKWNGVNPFEKMPR